MANQNYAPLADQIVGLLGGKTNIVLFTHCATRLRFNVADKDKVDSEKIAALPAVVGTSWAGQQLQVIIGPAVGDAYQEIARKNGLTEEAPINENLDEAKKKRTPKEIALAVLDYITGSLTPLIPVLVACGMLKTIVTVLTSTGLVDAASSTITVMTWVGDAGFYFFPILIGKNAAKKLGANEGLGMVLGAILIHPTFVNGIAEGTAFHIFNIPIYAATYKSTVFPILLCVAVMAPVQKFFAKHSPAVLRSLLEPTLTLLVMFPLSLCLLAPLGGYLGNYVASAVIWLYDTLGFVGVGFFAAAFPIIVMMGMHTALIPYMVTMFSTTGREGIYVVASFISNFNQGAACLAVALKTKDKDLESTATSCAVTSILGGISEPAFFGVTLPLRSPFMGVLCGNLLAGMLAGLLKVFAYSTPGSGSVFGLPSFIGPTVSNLIFYLICLVVGMAVTFVTTLILYRPNTTKAVKEA